MPPRQVKICEPGGTGILLPLFGDEEQAVRVLLEGGVAAASDQLLAGMAQRIESGSLSAWLAMVVHGRRDCF